jgi:glycosyltransferase involved in cell wall biosynthesis
MVVHSYYEEDPRVRREAETLVRGGHVVDVFALRAPGMPKVEVIDGVTLHRLGVARHQGASLATYIAEYAAFTARAAFALAAAHRRRRYGLVQVHSIPDYLVVAALPLRWLGVPLILDLHEAMPEFFRSRFAARLPRALVRPAVGLVRGQERLSIALADRVVTVNDALGDRLLALGVPAAKLSIVPNSPSLSLFDPAAYPARTFAADGMIRLVYAGALSPTYEVDVAVEALARVRSERPELHARLDLYGRDFGEVPLRERAEALGIGAHVVLHGRIPIDDVPAAIAGADIGLAPTRRSPFTDFSLSTKVFEYAAMGKPVIASRLPLVERTFGPDTVLTYDPGNADDLAAAILHLVDDAADRSTRVERTLERVRELSWDRAGPEYVALVESLALRSPAASHPATRDRQAMR